MVEWMILEIWKLGGGTRCSIVKRGLGTHGEAMKAMKEIIDQEMMAMSNTDGNYKPKYKSISEVKLDHDFQIIKVTRQINYEVQCSLDVKAVPKELPDMVQAPKTGGG